MDAFEFQNHLTHLGVGPSVSSTDLERAHMRLAFAARQRGELAEVDQLKTSFEAVRPVIQAREQAEARERTETARDKSGEIEEARLMEQVLSEPSPSLWDPRSFQSPWINLLAMPLVVGIAWLINASPLQFFLRAFYIWIHEFGHASVAWMSGYKALPLPLGWTTISPTKETFVYWGILFLLSVFFVAGWKERRIWPLILAPVIALAQWWMTWVVPDWRTEMWNDFGGVGGEFYLSALMVGSFFIALPDKFRWGTCRYLFLFIGAGCFLESYHFWQEVEAGREEIPWGTMIHGEDDEGGDMNKLHQGWGWPRQKIIQIYTTLGNTCILAVAAIYLIFNLASLRKGVRS
ncbi:MAG: hypothetical protein HOH58_00195 [Opitutaceae bacterium]|nr:hypothetical protein [Opitutaceae bacterium]